MSQLTVTFLVHVSAEAHAKSKCDDDYRVSNSTARNCFFRGSGMTYEWNF